MKTTAQKLVTYCREGREVEGLGEYYHADAVSVEAAPMEGAESAEARGLEAIRAKHAWWDANFAVSALKVEGPFHHGEDRFTVIFEIDGAPKAGGERFNMREVAVYTTDAAGLIVREEFFAPA
ncbi:hypothetical protein BH23PSE1_BH23PSE1_17100 [soil metagenome]